MKAEEGKKKKESAYSGEHQAVDLKSRKVKLSDGHFIPALVYGTYVPPEVTIVVWG